MSPAAIALHRLAADHAHIGKHAASRVYTRHALAQGWHGTPAWIEHREAFMHAWRQARAEWAAENPDDMQRQLDRHPTPLAGGDEWRQTLGGWNAL
jgi:hypothetical protein